jgi:hypothetical protein
LLSFTSAYFFESRLFNGLQSIQIKKFLRHRISRFTILICLIASGGAEWRPGFDPSIGRIYSMDSDSRKDNSQAFGFLSWRRILRSPSSRHWHAALAYVTALHH